MRKRGLQLENPEGEIMATVPLDTALTDPYTAAKLDLLDAIMDALDLTLREVPLGTKKGAK